MYTAITQFAEDMLSKHMLSDWSFRINPNPMRRVGCCKHGLKVIEISKFAADSAPMEIQRMVVLHELAHALCPHQKHNEIWAAKARELGIKDPSWAIDLQSAGVFPEEHDNRFKFVSVLALRVAGTIQRVDASRTPPRRIHTRYVRGQRERTLGHIFCIEAPIWLAFKNKHLCAGDILYYLGLLDGDWPPRALDVLKAHRNQPQPKRVLGSQYTAFAGSIYTAGMDFVAFVAKYRASKPTAANSTIRAQYLRVKKASA